MRIILAFSVLLLPVKPVSVPHVGSLEDKYLFSSERGQWSVVSAAISREFELKTSLCYLSSGGAQAWLTGASGGMRASSVSRRSSSWVLIVL